MAGLSTRHMYLIGRMGFNFPHSDFICPLSPPSEQAAVFLPSGGVIFFSEFAGDDDVDDSVELDSSSLGKQAPLPLGDGLDLPGLPDVAVLLPTYQTKRVVALKNSFAARGAAPRCLFRFRSPETRPPCDLDLHTIEKGRAPIRGERGGGGKRVNAFLSELLITMLGGTVVEQQGPSSNLYRCDDDQTKRPLPAIGRLAAAGHAVKMPRELSCWSVGIVPYCHLQQLPVTARFRLSCVAVIRGTAYWIRLQSY
ncbi:hypothetical protein HD554DRAFT_2330316, partial [Boletus coccyginus]